MLEEGRTIPCSSMWSNSRQAILSFSGDSLRARAAIEGPLTCMWCETLCSTCCSFTRTWVTEGNSLKGRVGRSDSLYTQVCDTIQQLVVNNVYRQVEMTEEIGHQDGLADIGKY